MNMMTVGLVEGWANFYEPWVLEFDRGAGLGADGWSVLVKI